MSPRGRSLFGDPRGLGALQALRRSAVGRRARRPPASPRRLRGDLGPAQARRGRGLRGLAPADSRGRALRAGRPAGRDFAETVDGHGRLGAEAAVDRAGADALALPDDLHPSPAGRGHDPGLALALRHQPGQGRLARADARAEPGVPQALASPDQPVAPDDPGRRGHAPLARRAEQHEGPAE